MVMRQSSGHVVSAVKAERPNQTHLCPSTDDALAQSMHRISPSQPTDVSFNRRIAIAVRPIASDPQKT